MAFLFLRQNLLIMVERLDLKLILRYYGIMDAWFKFFFFVKTCHTFYSLVAESLPIFLWSLTYLSLVADSCGIGIWSSRWLAWWQKCNGTDCSAGIKAIEFYWSFPQKIFSSFFDFSGCSPSHITTLHLSSKADKC